MKGKYRQKSGAGENEGKPCRQYGGVEKTQNMSMTAMWGGKKTAGRRKKA